MTVRLYKSTDAGAPVLTGQTGSLVALLDACLVNGYGAKPAAGWTKAFAAANKGAYKQDTAASLNALGMLLYVDDTGPGAGSSREARCCGFETMSAITPTGTGQFPTAAQTAIVGGFVAIRKSNTADATARAWTLIANGQSFYLFTESGDNTLPVGAATFFFGDIKPYKPADQYAVMIMGRISENGSTSQNDPMQVIGHITPSSGNLNQKYYGHFMARSWTGLGGSVQVGKTFDWAKLGGSVPMQYQADNNTQTIANGGVALTMGRNTTVSGNIFAAPNGPDGALYLSPVYVFHNFAFRGYLPGLWAPLQDRPLTHNDTITIATGNLTGKSLIAQQFMAYVGQGLGTADFGVVCAEYSDTWT
jgi:hypothetical protein